MAAIKIQSVYRGYLFRKHQALADKYDRLARTIQTAWRNYLNQVKCMNIRIIMALFRIRRAVIRYRVKLCAAKTMRDLARFDNVLAFYPSKSRPPSKTRARASNVTSTGLVPVPYVPSTVPRGKLNTMSAT
jgi:hypothetical protein